MPLAPLADVADLPTGWIDHPDVTRALEVASSAIREAAGVPIDQQTATVRVMAGRGSLLRLPGPITSVASVSINGRDATDYTWLPEGLWRRHGWGCDPTPVTVTYTFGLADVPPDIADMAVQLATAWLLHRDEGGGSTAGLKSARVDDAAEGYTDEAAGQVSPVYIPEVTRNWLQHRFNSSGVTVVETL